MSFSHLERAAVRFCKLRLVAALPSLAPSASHAVRQASTFASAPTRQWAAASSEKLVFAQSTSIASARSFHQSLSAPEESKTCYVGSLSWNIDDAALQSEFEHIGKIVSANVITDRATGRSKGFGYIEFEDASSAQKAISEMNGSDLDGRSIRVDISAPRAPREVKPLNPESDIVYVGNLPFEADETSIQDALSQFGSINDIRLISDRETGESRGFGYVTFKDISAAKAAVAAGTGEGIQVDGRALRLDFSKPQNDRPSSGGRERSSFGGSSYGGRDGGSRQGGYRSDRDGGRPPMRGYGNGNGRDNSRGGGARGGGRSRRDDDY